MFYHKKAGIAGLILGILVGSILGAWFVLEMRARQAPVEVDYIEEV